VYFSPQLRRLLNGVFRDDLRLEGKYFGVRGVYRSAYPVNIGVAERLYASEILNPLSSRCGRHGLVYPEGVGVAVHEDDGLAEGECLTLEGAEKVL
jgi:hypothetical protein